MAWQDASAADTGDAWYDGTPLTSLLGRLAAEAPHTSAFGFVDFSGDRRGTETTLTWSQLDRRARAVAAELAAVVPPGQRAAVLAPQGLEHVVAFLGALYAGVVAVPLFAPGAGGHSDRLVSAIADADAEVWLTTSAALDATRALADQAPVPRPKRTLAVDAIAADRADGFTPPALAGDEAAYLQYTSGSTRAPAGAVITHRNVVANARQVLRAIGRPAAGPMTAVGWLPLFHDMGLVLSVAAPIVGGLRSVFMDPFAFVQRPARWLRLLAACPGAASAGPDFAFAHCLSRVSEAERAELDLSSVFALINGSEPIRAGTLARFAEVFADQGLRPEALRPAYGLAEATVFVTVTAPGQAPAASRFDRAALGAGWALPADDPADPDDDAVVSIGCGRPVGQDLLIVDPDTGAALPAGRVGEIWVRGANVAAGYWGAAPPGDPGDAAPGQGETGSVDGPRGAAVFDARPAGAPPGDRPWLRTGDLGVLHGGQLHVTGRIKDLIIVAGRNHYPQDIEATVQDAHPAVRPGHVAAFPASADPDDGVVVVAEYAPRRAPAAERDPLVVAQAVRRAVSRRHELSTRDFLLVPPGSVPRTSSGKIARSACRDRYLAGGYAEADAPRGARI